MATPNPSTAPVGAVPAGPIEQLLVMHCLKEDSVLGREGFSVRAASPGATDPPTLDWALRLDSYELPLDMKGGMLLTNQAPRRLARVPGPPGRVALIHTAYLPEDTLGRSHSFISQILLLPELETISAVTAWGSSDWQTDEYAQGETKSLSPLEHLPRGPLIDDAALTAFLSDGPSPADQSLARSIYPGRAESNPDARRRWIRATLHGFLRTGEANSARTRVCVLAEPGTVALLVYAIARLLPPQLVGSFPFSTYEPPHSSLRENKVARVIGSYARNGIDRPDSDALRRRGYVVDTLRDAYGPELLIEPSWPLEGLLNLVADGDWPAVDEIRDLWSRDPQIAKTATPELLAQAIRVRPLAASLKAGTIDTDGLIELRRNRFGEGLLRDNELRRRAWEAVRKVWTRPKVRDDFADLIREHLDELLAEVRKRAQSEPAGAWREGWEVLKPLVQADRRAGCFATLVEAVAATPAVAVLAPEERISLLREWSSLSAAPGTALPPALRWLLQASDPPAFRSLIKLSGLDPHHAGLAACLALSGSSGWQPDLGLLNDLTDDQFRAFIAELERFDRQAATFERLHSDRKLAELLVDRVRRTRPKVSPAWLEDLLLAIHCDESAWHNYWLTNNHFPEILTLLDAESRESRLSRRLWASLVERITIDNYDEMNWSPVLESLAGLSDQFPRSLTGEDAERLKGWNTLSIHFASPPKTPAPGTAARLRTACKAVGQNPEELFERWFNKRIVRARTNPDRERISGVLGRSILGFLENEDQACEVALKLAERENDLERRRKCKADLFNAIVSDGNKDRLAQKYERELRETSIRPQPVRLRDPVRSPSPGKKGLGVGTLRLSPEATPYVGSFVGGSVFTAVLMLVLFFSGALDLLSASGPNSSGVPHVGKGKEAPSDVTGKLDKSEQNGEKDTEVSTKSEPDPKGPDPKAAELAELAASKSEITNLKKELADRASEITNLKKELAASKMQLESLAKEGSRPGGPAPAKAVSWVDRLHDGMAEYNVPTDIFSKGKEADTSKTDFAFLTSGKDGRLALATFGGRKRSLTFYFLDLTQSPPWINQVRVEQSNVLSSDFSGDFFLLGRAAQGALDELNLVKSAVFYEDNIKNMRTDLCKYGSLFKLQLPVGVAAKVAVSDGGKWFAFAESDWGKMLSPPKVEVRATHGESRPQNPLDFAPFRNELQDDWRISAMSFDHDARTLVVGFEEKPILLAFGLVPDPASRKSIDYNMPVRGWAHSLDGRLAVVTKLQVFVDELVALRDGKQASPRPIVNGQKSVNLNCVAFGSKGTILATGDESGEVSVRRLRERDGDRDVLRLPNAGPVLKLAFSPDGRVLAALVKPKSGSGNTQIGTIRLWVRENWESASDGEAGHPPPSPPPERRG